MYVNRNVQSPAFLTSGLIRDVKAEHGWSVGRGKWSFQPNTWTKMKQVVKLNSVNPMGRIYTNGEITISVNGVEKLKAEKVVLRNKGTIWAEGIMFDTFFGGNKPEYETPVAQTVQFKDFSVYAG